MYINNKFILLLVLIPLFYACSSDDDGIAAEDFVVAFASPSISFNPEDQTKVVELVFSRAATAQGSITLTYTATGSIYGEDFSTAPEAVSETLTLPIVPGTSGTSFEFHKLQNPLEGTEAHIEFLIEAISISGAYTQGNTSVVIHLDDAAALGGAMYPEVGGPNQPNQVYIDLSAQNQTVVHRESWDLGFYSGNAHRVILNGSLYMAAAPLNTTNIDAVTEADAAHLFGQVAIGTFDPENMEYVDAPDGSLSGTAIAAISENDQDNKVYLLNMGYEVGTTTPNPGSIAVAGEHRGWKKIRITRSGDAYVIQYADLNSATHQAVTISKSAGYNFSFFSIVNQQEVAVEPQAAKWDIHFTVFTNEIEGNGSYGFADFVASNRLGGVTGYAVNSTGVSYENFSISHIEESLLTQDRRFIGSNWRIGGGPDTLPTLAENVFFILKDPDGNYYKLRFTALLNEDGIRGYPAFEYKLL